MKKSILLLLFMLAEPSFAYAESIKNFLKEINKNNYVESNIYFYWRGMLDTTMYTMGHKHIRWDIPNFHLCYPKKLPSDKEFFKFYLQYINAEIEAKGRGAVEQQEMDQIMFKMWYTLFNCENPVWKGTVPVK